MRLFRRRVLGVGYWRGEGYNLRDTWKRKMIPYITHLKYFGGGGGNVC